MKRKNQNQTNLYHKQASVENLPTVVSFVMDALVFRVENRFLQHAEDNDGTNPELDPQQIPPITGAPEEPENPKQHVNNAHDHEELWWAQEWETVSALSSIISKLYTQVPVLWWKILHVWIHQLPLLLDIAIKYYRKWGFIPSWEASLLERSTHVDLSSPLSLGNKEKCVIV